MLFGSVLHIFWLLAEIRGKFLVVSLALVIIRKRVEAFVANAFMSSGGAYSCCGVKILDVVS